MVEKTAGLTTLPPFVLSKFEWDVLPAPLLNSEITLEGGTPNRMNKA